MLNKYASYFVLLYEQVLSPCDINLISSAPEGQNHHVSLNVTAIVLNITPAIIQTMVAISSTISPTPVICVYVQSVFVHVCVGLLIRFICFERSQRLQHVLYQLIHFSITSWLCFLMFRPRCKDVYYQS